ncbi:DMT family transporter [Candidatus Pacearchaeota archaeon]|nr:DMT family transporter [Candidatus Pacearchaeota archaeon]
MVAGFLISAVGALVLAVGTIIQRIMLKKKKVGIKLYQTAEFAAMVLVSLPLLFFFWRLDAQALELRNIIIFIIVGIFSIIANLFLYYSMKWEKVTHIEPAKLTESLFVIILAIIFSFIFGEGLYERDLRVIIPALIASLALIFSHIRKHHLDFNKYFIAAILGSFFFALELVISRLILDFYSPITFYFMRCALILAISLIAFRPNLNTFNRREKTSILFVGLMWVIYRFVIYYGFVNSGVIFTTLMIMISTVFIYFFAWKFLKEKIEWRNIVAAGIIVASIVYVLLT